jgi:hypothetical protein
VRPYLEKRLVEWLSEDPEFKPQYCKNKTKLMELVCWPQFSDEEPKRRSWDWNCSFKLQVSHNGNTALTNSFLHTLGWEYRAWIQSLAK